MSFILDSGADESVLAKGTAKEIGLGHVRAEQIRTIRGIEGASRGETIHIELGETRFSPDPLVMDLSSQSRTLGTRIDGLLGADFFEGRAIKIDFKQSRLHLSPSGKPGPRATRLPLARSGGAFFIGLTAADSPLSRVRLDTGCNRSLCWTPPEASPLRSKWRSGDTLEIDVNLGSLAMSQVPSHVYRKPLFAGEDGLFGTALLSRFDAVWIDAIQNRITFDGARN